MSSIGLIRVALVLGDDVVYAILGEEEKIECFAEVDFFDFC